MTTYLITSPHFCVGVVVSHDHVVQTAPIIKWTLGKPFANVRDYCRKRGWTIEPCPTQSNPVWLEYDGVSYELGWDGDTVHRVIAYEPGVEPRELTARQLPQCLKNILNERNGESDEDM